MRQHILARKTELKAIAQETSKKIQLVFEKYKNGNIKKYGWYRYENKELVENKASVCLKDYMKVTYKHTITTRDFYIMNIEGHLVNEVIKEIVIGIFKKCEIKGNIYNLK